MDNQYGQAVIGMPVEESEITESPVRAISYAPKGMGLKSKKDQKIISLASTVQGTVIK